jgi:adenylate cyclase
VLEERIRNAKAVVVIWSKDAVEGNYVRAEAETARPAGTLVQISVNGTVPPLPFNTIQFADMTGWTGDANAPGRGCLSAPGAAHRRATKDSCHDDTVTRT